MNCSAGKESFFLCTAIEIVMSQYTKIIVKSCWRVRGCVALTDKLGREVSWFIPTTNRLLLFFESASTSITMSRINFEWINFESCTSTPILISSLLTLFYVITFWLYSGPDHLNFASWGEGSAGTTPEASPRGLREQKEGAATREVEVGGPEWPQNLGITEPEVCTHDLWIPWRENTMPIASVQLHSYMW